MNVQIYENGDKKYRNKSKWERIDERYRWKLFKKRTSKKITKIECQKKLKV